MHLCMNLGKQSEIGEHRIVAKSSERTDALAYVLCNINHGQCALWKMYEWKRQYLLNDRFNTYSMFNVKSQQKRCMI